MIMMTLLAISAASFGAEEISTSKKVHDYIKDKIEFAYHGEYYFLHDADNKLSDFNHLHLPMLAYKFAPDWKFNASAEFKYTDNEAEAYPNRYFRSLYTVTKENILTEKVHGVKMNLGIGRRVMDRKSAPNGYGNNRVFANFSRAIPGGIGKNNASLLTQYLYNDPKNILAGTWRHAVELLPTINLQLTEKLLLTLQDDINFYTSHLDSNPRTTQLTHEAYSTLTYQHNDKLSSFLQFEWVHADSFAAPKKPGPYESDTLQYYIGIGYNITPKFTLTPQLGNEIFASSDGKVLSDKFKYIDFTLLLDFAF
jgi:hypothetical protein